MELTLESALSPQGLFGHTSYILLVISMMMRRMVWLRILVILSAIVGITYASVVLRADSVHCGSYPHELK
jgi:hypothetical protein